MAESPNLLAFFTIQESKGRQVITELPKLELESYIQNYTGKSRLDRLIHIGTSSVPLCVEALKAAVVEAKSGKNVKAYATAQDLLRSAAPNEPEAVWDQAWVDRTEKSNNTTTKELDAQLKTYKNNLVKESIRMGHEDLAKHLWATGALAQAYEALVKMRSDVQTAKQVVEVSKLIIDLAIDQRNWIMVLGHVQKVRQLQQNPAEEELVQPSLQIATGLSHLAGRSYRAAANAFLFTDPTTAASTGGSGNVSPNDVAIYGTLCALASLDRNEMQKVVLDSPTFRAFLELEPHLRRAVTFFVNSRFPACLEILKAYRVDYQLDLWLAPHIAELYRQVENKAIVQYFIPFSCVTLDSMATMFGPDKQPIDNQLVEMIERGTLDGRIDTENRLLMAVPSLARSNLQTQSLESAQDYAREARRRIQRMNLINADLDVKPTKNTSKQGFQDDMEGYSGMGQFQTYSSQQYGNAGSVDQNGFQRSF